MIATQMNPTTIANMSLYIPHVFSNFTEDYIAAVFEELEIGCVDHVDLVSKLDHSGKPYNSAYIHFQYWYSGPIAENFQARVQDPSKEARIVHDDPWYWIILENTATKYEPGARKVCLDLSEPEQEPRVQFIEIAPGLSKVMFSQEMEEEIDTLINPISNRPMDLSYELEGYVDEEIGILKAENMDLQAENVSLRDEIEHLNEQNIGLREKLDKNDNLEQEFYNLKYELFQKNLALDEAQCEHGRTAQELEDTQHDLAIRDLEEARMNTFCHSILNADTLEEVKNKICQELFQLSYEAYNQKRNNS
uniref:Uncharacterized protein n=1 Tax=viral metagenome TaxID=1070528 RepID=A0A6C0ASJ9_9ZZZZ